VEGSWFFPELLYLALMVGVFALCAMRLKLPIGISMLLGCAPVLMAVDPRGLPRHLVEGAFGYLDTILLILCATFFMKVLQALGFMGDLAAFATSRLSGRPRLAGLALGLLVMLPGMITGSSTAAVLTSGVLVSPILMELGLPRDRTGAFVAMAAILGMIAPPVNIPAMIIGGGVDMPYIGFGLPLLWATLVPFVFSSLWIMGSELGSGSRRISASAFPWLKGIPFWVLLLLMVGEKAWPSTLGLPGMTMFFLASALFGLLVDRRLNLVGIFGEALRSALPVMGILVGVGAFIQTMTLSGVRGFVVVSFLSFPSWLLYLGVALGLPLFGAVSSFGSASVLGVPFLLAFLGRDDVSVASGLSLIAGLGDLVPPTALSAIFAAQVVGEEDYFKVLRFCLVPALFALVWGLSMIVWAGKLPLSYR